ncbi:MAG TPA: thioredoxin family protein [Spirochaetota bacterium]|mgnify:CR=1 FL=1|nr:thioredoxin family protein [Spirochaetota bacterium]HOS38907.1 thioredoxin family protein [Spirochaetota bacterium]HPU88226.1 thioredoxin family protein [Spirochaetota bacterium]
MKRILKVTIPALAAIAIVTALPHLKSGDGCSCQTPLIVFGSLFGCSDTKQPENTPVPIASNDVAAVPAGMPEKKAGPVEHKVTFVEIGSVNCIPCRMMQPIMKAVEEEYKGQVKVVFHDVWTPQGKRDAMKYGIRVIPTQIFLDKNGVEYFRHEGFYPKEQVVRALKMKGVN